MHTPDEITKGMALDRLVEEALGTDMEQLIQDTWLWFRRTNAGKGMSGSEPYDPLERDRMLDIAVPRYSLTDEAAMLLVDKMVKLGYRFEMDRGAHFTEARFIIYKDGIETHGWEEAHAMPVAICGAMLRVKGLVEGQEDWED